MFGIRVQQRAAFDRSAIRRRWQRDMNNPLKRAGAILMRASRERLKKVGKKDRVPSMPGQSPKSRAKGHPLRKIFFDVEKAASSLVVGPVGFGSPRPVTELHEKGGRRVVRKRSRSGETQRRTVRYAPRPYMWAAFQEVKDKLPALWRHSVRH